MVRHLIPLFISRFFVGTCTGKLRTGSLGREVLFSLHNSRNVGEALRLFGVKGQHATPDMMC